ncbi:MAG: 50S ribosomal protein L33 [Polyangiales bacterium]
MGERARIVLVCSVCGARNYQTTKVKRPSAGEERLAKKKYCPHCKKHEEHKESK